MKKKKCIKCKKMSNILPCGVCLECAQEIYYEANAVFKEMDLDVRSTCNIIDKGDVTTPIELCKCNSLYIIPIDYFCVEYENAYRVILNGICRGCGGYKELPSSLIHPINIKPTSKESGYFLNGKTKKVDYIS